MSGAAIAAEIAAALAEAGEATGAGPLICTLEKFIDARTNPLQPLPVSQSFYPLTAVDFPVRIRDQAEILVGRTQRTLTVNATGAVPEKNDRIAVGVAPDVAVTNSGYWHRIIEVRPLAPGGTALLYEIDIEN